MFIKNKIHADQFAKDYHLIGNRICNTCSRDTKKISGDVSTEIIKIAYL